MRPSQHAGNFFLTLPFDQADAQQAPRFVAVESLVVIHFASLTLAAPRVRSSAQTGASHTARCVARRATIYAACQESIEVSQGTIKKLTDKGFGFIKGDQGEIFFHSSAVVNASYESLQEGQAVEYSEGTGPKGPRAENVKVIG